ncbi:DHH family phosphoesterase [Halorubrum sp. DTA98]|uniref:DHH family phosphoesterase n=1 Tax=Halorubrum sp. DTA98 TaxID=3402163 RepID=UPI003AAEDD30
MSSGARGSARTRYAILGCGSVGHAVAEELTDRGKDVLILDRDESRVEALRDQDLNAQVQDVAEPSVVDAIGDRDIILVLASDVEVNKAAVSAIRETGGDHYVVVRASDPVSEDELRDRGADVVITPSTVIADSALQSLETGELEYMARQLAEIIEGSDGRMAILTHDNPEPDSIASATALQAIAAAFDVDADILYAGDVGHQENRAFVNLLGIDLLARSEAPPLSEYETLAAVDLAKSGEGNVDLGADLDVYIDHYEADTPIDARFVDVRTNVSSTSTILTKYLQEFDLSPSEAVATALLYGIRAETLDFKRDTTPADLTAAAYLHPFANHDTLEQVESPSMSPETLDVLAEAIQNRQVQGSHLFSTAGFIRDREALAQAAQHLLNLEGITTTAVLGVADDHIYLAARSKDIRINIGNVLQEAFAEMGEAAGHSTQGSVEIPLGIFTGIETSEENRDTLLQLTEEAVRRKLFDAMGVEGGGDGSNGS